MRALVAFAALLFFVPPALAEQKAPDGFGPIKFGMTIEEAREATGGEGRWVNDDTMVSKQGLPSKLKNNFDIMINFDNDIVRRIVIEIVENEQARIFCISDLQFIITMIYKKYTIKPIYIKSLNIELNTREEYYFIFPFDNNINIYVDASIAISSEIDDVRLRNSCHIRVTYIDYDFSSENPF